MFSLFTFLKRSIGYIALLPIASAASAQTQCAPYPSSGLVTIAADTTPNSFYPGTGNPTAGSSSLTTGSIDSRGSSAPLAIGDVILIMQMQGADINAGDADTYGDGVVGAPATGYLSSNLYAGTYEYNVIAGITGSTITLSAPLTNNYYTQDFDQATAAGIRRFQVIRIPAYYNVAIATGVTVTAPVWNGSTGGVLALEARDTMFINGAANVSGKGFRGGGGHNQAGASPSNTAYVFQSSVTNPAYASGGAKGEGIAGTPIYVYEGLPATTVTTLAVEGYINGAVGRGAPGNAGGGGTDGSTTDNQYNPGGGGGGNGGPGGMGGSGWHGGTGNEFTYPTGGYGGSMFSNFTATGQLVMGGGGGSGTANNSTASSEYMVSGAPGGGIVLLRAGQFTGNGSVSANGGNAPGVYPDGTSNTDAAGGGGAGGTIVLVNRSSGSINSTGITLSATGGAGGDMTTYYDHGPGGGGGGGVIYAMSDLGGTPVVTGGIHGYTRTGSPGGTLDNTYGSASGNDGVVIRPATTPVLAGTGTIFYCTANLTGNVFDDTDGGNINGTGTNAGSALYVNIIDGMGTVIATTPVAADGSYRFVGLANGTYTAIVTTSSAATTDMLPAGWVNTAEGTTAAGDGTANGSFAITIHGDDSKDADFGIDRIPTSNGNGYTITTPAPNSVRTLTAANGLGILTGNDAEQGTLGSGNSFTINSLAGLNGNTLLYNGVPVIAGQTIANYDTTLLAIRFDGTSSTDASFTFSFVDAAGKASGTPATFAVNWAVPLPVTLISFDAAVSGVVVALDWTVAGEEAIAGYGVQHSTNGNAWTSIAMLPATGKNNYQATDATPATGLNYYRLQINEQHGGFHYSPVRTVRFDGHTTTVSILPNPVSGILTISGLNGATVTDIYATDGMRVAHLTGKDATITIDCSGYANGSYLLRIADNTGAVFTRQIIKK